MLGDCFLDDVKEQQQGGDSKQGCGFDPVGWVGLGWIGVRRNRTASSAQLQPTFPQAEGPREVHRAPMAKLEPAKHLLQLGKI